MSASSYPAYFQRAWKITITPKAGEELTFSNIGELDTIRASFIIDMSLTAWWNADITLQNLSPAVEQQLLASGARPGANAPIEQGDMVTVSAGYLHDFTADNSVIFRGRVFQPMWYRDNVTDFKVTLRCIIGLYEDARNLISNFSPALTTQANIVQQMANEAHVQVSVPSTLTKQLPRAKAYFGSFGECARQTALDNQLQYWTDSFRHNLQSLSAGGNRLPDIVYAPPHITNVPNSQSSSGVTKQTLIGVPQQVEQGVEFRVLLDAQPQIGSLVKLDMSAIRQQGMSMGSWPSILNQDGQYVINRIRHVGDSRGQEWYTEMSGLSQAWLQIYGGIAQ